MGYRRLRGCPYAAKWLLGIINTVCMIGGVGMVVLGAYTAEREHVFALRPFGVPTGLVILGAAVFLLSFLGCFAVGRENTCLLKTYFASLLVIVATQIILGAIAYRYRGHMYEGLRDAWANASTGTRNSLQAEFHCCGFLSPDDVGTFRVYPDGAVDICDTTHAAPPYTTYSEGCFTKIRDEVAHHSLVAEAVGFALAAVEVAALALSWILLAAIAEREWAAATGEGDALLAAEGGRRMSIVREIPTVPAPPPPTTVLLYPSMQGLC